MTTVVFVVTCSTSGSHLALADCPTMEPVVDQACEAEATTILRSIWAEVRSRGALPSKDAPSDTQAATYAALVQAALDAYHKRAPACMPQTFQHWLAADMACAHPAALGSSTEAAASNPQAVKGIEGSSVLQRLAVALSGTNLVSANDTAVTINIGAFGLAGEAIGKAKKDPPPKAAAADSYQRAGVLNRLGGSLTFGEKLPEKAITGFSGFPDTGKLFSAVSWDGKVRLIGDRDPRASAWNTEIERLGEASWANAKLLSVVDEEALRGVQTALAARGLADLEATRDHIARSLQVSIKVAGQYLTDEPGKNKFSGTLLLDKGLGVTNLTVNAGYEVVDNTVQAASSKFKTWKLSAGISGSISGLVGSLSNGSADWTLTAQAQLPSDGRGTSVNRKAVWSGQAALNVPVSTKANVPLSVTLTNDPNNLTKQKYVRGALGISYDFSSLKDLVSKTSTTH